MARGLEVSHLRCNSARDGRSRTFWGSKTGIEPPFRLWSVLSEHQTHSVKSMISKPLAHTTASLCLRKWTLSASVGMKKSLYSRNHSDRCPKSGPNGRLCRSSTLRPKMGSKTRKRESIYTVSGKNWIRLTPFLFI